MRILVLQFVPGTRRRPVPRFEPQLGTLLALLERRGHTLGLLGLAGFDLEAVKAALARSLPQLIYADISPVCVDAARRTFEYIERREYLPIVVGGLYPTVEPAAALSLPGVHAAAIGEPDASLVTYLERIKDPAVRQIVSGVWLRDEQGLARPAPPPLVEDLSSLPFPHRELFGYAAHVARDGELEIAVGRGCPQHCGYCLNPGLATLYAGRGVWVRRRPVGHILAEIAALRERYPGARRIRFLDHALTLDRAWLAEFLAAYRTRCGLPWRGHVRANATDSELAAQLAASGCVEVTLELISASDFIRNDVFTMDLSGEQIAAAHAALRTAGLRTRVTVYVGAPYESEASLAETRAMLLSLRPDVVDVRPYFPWPGTAARELAREHGWLHSRGEEQYHREYPGIDMPACRPGIVGRFVRRLRAELPTEVAEPWWRRWPATAAANLAAVFERRRL